jgi:hypothetical protein
MNAYSNRGERGKEKAICLRARGTKPRHWPILQRVWVSPLCRANGQSTGRVHGSGTTAASHFSNPVAWKLLARNGVIEDEFMSYDGDPCVSGR